MTKILPRSRQDFSEISAAKNLPGISPRFSLRLARSRLKFCTGNACFIVRSNKRFFVSLPVFVIQLGDLVMVGTANIVM